MIHSQKKLFAIGSGEFQHQSSIRTSAHTLFSPLLILTQTVKFSLRRQRMKVILNLCRYWYQLLTKLTISANLISLVDLKQQNPNIKIMISIANNFRAISTNARNEFAVNVRNFILKYNLDGVGEWFVCCYLRYVSLNCIVNQAASAASNWIT